MEVTSRSRHPKRVDTSIVSTLDIGKVCLCNTNRRLYHKDPCPERGLNHSKVVIIIYPLSYFKVVSKKQDYSGIPSFRVFDDEKGCPNMYFK